MASLSLPVTHKRILLSDHMDISQQPLASYLTSIDEESWHSPKPFMALYRASASLPASKSGWSAIVPLNSYNKNNKCLVVGFIEQWSPRVVARLILSNPMNNKHSKCLLSILKDKITWSKTAFNIMTYFQGIYLELNALSQIFFSVFKHKFSEVVV